VQTRDHQLDRDPAVLTGPLSAPLLAVGGVVVPTWVFDGRTAVSAGSARCASSPSQEVRANKIDSEKWS
jgi:hypothetical protein